jgi:5-methylcytosine-specific restriction endonuclease McrA
MSGATSPLTHRMASLDSVTTSVLADFWHGLWAQPWLGALVTVVVARACLRAVREAVHGGHPRDPIRTFSRADKSVLLARAGGRCEHHRPLAGRCEQTLRLEADHVHPHSRGGWTALANGQVLCRRHNKAKAARVPWSWELNRLARRRQSYFPPGTPPAVIRHRPSTADV